jgi:hypothetical protein
MGGALQGQVVVPDTTDFETSGGYTVGNLHGQNFWQVTQGSAAITTAFAFSGAQSVLLSPNSPPSTIKQTFAQLVGQDVIFVDFYARPVVSVHLDVTTLIDAEASRVAFVKVGITGEVYAFDGDGLGGPQKRGHALPFTLTVGGPAPGWGHGAQAAAGISRGDLSRDQPGQLPRGYFPSRIRTSVV